MKAIDIIFSKIGLWKSEDKVVTYIYRYLFFVQIIKDWKFLTEWADQNKHQNHLHDDVHRAHLAIHIRKIHTFECTYDAMGFPRTIKELQIYNDYREIIDSND